MNKCIQREMRLILTGTMCSFFVLSSFAGTKIKVDKDDVNVGVILEGTKDKVRHIFTITNIGNEPLRIKEVKSS